MDKTLGFSVVIGAALGKGYFRAFESAEQRTRRLGATWQETNNKLKATGNVIKYKKLLGELKAKQAALGGSSQRLERGIEEVERRYKKARREAKGYGIQIGQVVREHERLNKTLKATERRQAALAKKQQAGSRLRELRGKMLGVAGAAYGTGRLLGAAMAREEQGLYLGTVINAKDGDKAAAAQRARSEARAFARESLASEEEILEIEYALNSAGLAEEAARAGGQLVHKLAKVTKGAPAQVGEIFADVFDNMGGSIEGTVDEKMQTIGNVLAKTQFKFAIRDFGQLGEGMKYVSSTAASLKLPLTQTASVIGHLNNSSLKGSQAGTAFEAVLRNLNKAADELGFEVVRDEKGELDMLATLEQLKEQLDGLDTDERDMLLQDVFDTEGKRAIVPLIDKLEELKRAHAEVARAGQSNLVDEEYARFLESASGQWTTLKQNIAQVGVVFANTLLPALNVASSFFAGIAGWASVTIERFPIIGHVIGAIGVAFATVGAAMIGVTAGTWALNAALAANPVGLIVAAAVTLGFALHTLATKITPIRTFLGGMWDGFMDGIAPVLDAFGQVFGWLGSLVTGTSEAKESMSDFSSSGRLVGEVIGKFFAVMGKLIGAALWGLSKLGAVLIPIGKLLISAVLLPFKALGASIQASIMIFSVAWQGIKTLLSFSPLGLIISNWGAIGGFFTSLWGGIVEQARAALDWLLGKFKTVISFIGNTWKAVSGWFGDKDETADTGQTPAENTDSPPENEDAEATTTPSAAELALAASLATAPLAAAATVHNTDHSTHSTHSYQLTINQQPSEDAEALARRVMAELEHLKGQQQREALSDGL